MKTHIANLVNASTLIILGLWGYFGSDTPSVTALIPPAIGVLLVLLNRGLKADNKVQAHIAVLLTLVVLIGLVKPLLGALGREDTEAVARVLLMMLTALYAMVTFVKSFIDARRKS